MTDTKRDWADEITATILADHNCEDLASTPMQRAIAEALRAERAATVALCVKIMKRAGVGGIARSAIYREFPDAQQSRREDNP